MQVGKSHLDALSSITGSGHAKYMASPVYDFYMTTYHVL